MPRVWRSATALAVTPWWNPGPAAGTMTGARLGGGDDNVMVRLQRSGHVLRSATFGCVPVADDDRTRAYLNDFCAALGEALKLDVRPHRAPSSTALASAFVSGRVHLAWTSPALAVSDAALSEATPLVHSVREGASQYHGVVFARADGPIQSLAQLEGATVAWVERSSAGGYLFPRLALAREGYAPERLFSRELMLSSHGAVAQAVRSGRVDAGATFAVFEDSDPTRALLIAGFAPQGEGRDEMRVLAVSPPIPSDVIVASGALLDTLTVDVVTVLEGLAGDERARVAMKHLLGADALTRCPPGYLDVLRRAVAQTEARAAAG